VSEHQLKAAGSSARTTTLACASCQTFLQGALHYLNILHVHTALWLKYGPICTLIPCLVRINFGTNCLDCFIDVWLVMFAARPDLCWIITATFDLIVGLKNKGGNSWDRCAPLRCILECKKILAILANAKNTTILANAKYGDLRQQKIRRSSPMQKIRRSSLIKKNGYLPRQKVWAAHFKRMNWPSHQWLMLIGSTVSSRNIS
jgi:hypothetical protein